MHIAFVSFEFPPDTGYGGIATYLLQIAKMFSERGIRVTVICSSPVNEGVEQVSSNLVVHKIHSGTRKEFVAYLPQKLRDVHQQHKIDIIEAPEHENEAQNIKETLTDVPLVIKLHIPGFLTKQLNDYYYNKRLIRKIWLLLKRKYQYKKDKEYQTILTADFIISPSLSLREIVSHTWHINKEAIIHAPNPYIASPELINIPVGSPGKTVLYIGRLESRKGVYELGKIIPAVLSLDPEVKFTLLGKDCIGPYRKKTMKKVLLEMCRGFESNIEFIDYVPLAKVPSVLEKADLCIFPSIWENFPCVCLEAMSAGKAVVASREGGMSEMIENNTGGILIDPFATEVIAQSIVNLIKEKVLLEKMGIANRKKVISYYNDKLVDDLILMYENFIRIFAEKAMKC